MSNINYNSDTAKLAGTDGCMLTTIEVDSKADNISLNINPIIFKILSKHSFKDSVNLSYCSNTNKIMCNIDNIELSSIVNKESYPKYEQIIPKHNKETFTVIIKDLKKALENIKSSIDENTNMLLIELDDNSIILNGLYSKPNNRLKVEMLNKPDYDKIALRYDYLKNILL